MIFHYDDKLIREELQHLRDEENMLLLEEIRLRERITTREINVVRDVGETSSQDDGNETEGDKLLLAEFDTRRDQLLSRIQDIVFDEEFRSISRSLPLGIVLSSLAGIHDKPSIEKSHTEDFKSTIRESWGNSYSRSKAGNQINRRVIVYVIALLVLTYFIFFKS